MNDLELAEELAGFAESANIDVDDVNLLVVLRIIASFSQIDASVVLEQAIRSGFGDAGGGAGRRRPIGVNDVDWGTMTARLNGDHYGNAKFLSGFWLRLVEFIGFVNEPGLTAEIDQYLLKLEKNMHCPLPCSFSPIDAVRIALQKTYGCRTEWSNTCRTFILLNVVQEDPASVITTFLKTTGLTPKSGQDETGVQMARHLMGFRNTAAENQETLIGLLTSYMVIETRAIESILRKRVQASSRMQ
eukprot:3442631-Rhodomonas_salina.1